MRAGSARIRGLADDGKRLPAMDVAFPLSLILLNKGRGLGRGGDPPDFFRGPADLFSVFFRVFFPRWFLVSVLKRPFVIFVVLGVPGEVTFGVFF